MALGLGTQAQDVYLGHVPALLLMGFGFLTRPRDETFLHFGIDPPFGFRSQKTPKRLQGHSWVGEGPVANNVAPASPACLGTDEGKARTAQASLPLAPAFLFQFRILFLFLCEHSMLST